MLMISILLGCRSVFMQANPYFVYAVVTISSVLSIMCVAIRKGAVLSKKLLSTMFVYLLIVSIVTIIVKNTSNGPFIISYWILVPLMLLYFLLLSYQEKMDWLKLFSDVIFVFIVLSTISWLIGPIFHWIQPTHTLEINWGGIKTYNGYLLCYKVVGKGIKNYFGFNFLTNDSIYVEAPITNVIYSLGYALYLFVKKDRNKIKEIIYIFAMITTMSATSVLLAAILFALRRIINSIETDNKCFIDFLKKYIFPLIIVIVACIAVSVILKIKANDDYGNYYAHTYALKSGFISWLSKPIDGYGYELGQEFYNTTSGLFKILVHGGIVFGLLYVIPFISSIVFAIEEKDFGLAIFCVLSFVLLILVIWHYSPAYMFVLAFEYSFMMDEIRQGHIAKKRGYLRYDTIKTRTF